MCIDQSSLGMAVWYFLIGRVVRNPIAFFGLGVEKTVRLPVMRLGW